MMDEPELDLDIKTNPYAQAKAVDVEPTRHRPNLKVEEEVPMTEDPRQLRLDIYG